MIGSARRGWRRIAVALFAASSTLPAQELSWSGSLGYTAGSYIFTEPFRTFALLNTLTLRSGWLELSASIPVLAQNGTSVSYVAGVPVPTGGPDNGAVQRRQQGQSIPVHGGRRGQGGNGGQGDVIFASLAGLTSDAVSGTVATEDSLAVAATGDYRVRVGDPMVGASISAYEGTGFVRAVGLDAWAKAPVAPISSGVGTGAWDYGVGGAFALGTGEVLVFLNATWWILGDMPDLPLQDALFYSISVGRPLGGAWSFMASASASTRIIAGADPPASASLLLSRRLSDGASLSITAGAGLTESASAFSCSIGWATRLLGGRR